MVILGREEPHNTSGPEYAGLVVDEPEEFEPQELKAPENDEPISLHREPAFRPPQDLHNDLHTTQWANDVSQNTRHKRSFSTSSERTLFGIRSTPFPQNSDDTLHDPVHDHYDHPKPPLFRRIGKIAHAVAERALVFTGFIQVLTGIVTYTGGCRGNYLNGCLAHLISTLASQHALPPADFFTTAEGGIFWCYGLFTFARFLGTFSEYGWAWNRAPSGNYPTAEFIESTVIFVYGISNTWMERFGANPDDGYTTKQVQHIGIAVSPPLALIVNMF